MRPIRRAGRTFLLCAVLALATSCTSTTGDPAGSASSTPTARQYLPGLTAEVRLPAIRAARTPTVVVVPGGSWRTADYRGMLPLADALSRAGIATVAISYRGTVDGGRFPEMVAQVICGADFAAGQVRSAGLEPGPVVILGHSAGAHLGALATLAPSHFRAGCPHPAAEVTGFVGLAGAYDVPQVGDLLVPFFGMAEHDDPQRWREGTPATWATARPGEPSLRILLLHGTADTVVPPAWSVTLADQLRDAGRPVTVQLVPDADHLSIFDADVAGPAVIEWLGAPAGTSPQRPRTTVTHE